MGAVARLAITYTAPVWTDDFLSPYTGSAGIVVDTFANAYVTGEHNFQVIADLLDLPRWRCWDPGRAWNCGGYFRERL